MKALVIIGCVVLYLAAGYITAWHIAATEKGHDDELTYVCVLLWPVMLAASLIWLLASYLPRKIFDKIRKR